MELSLKLFARLEFQLNGCIEGGALAAYGGFISFFFQLLWSFIGAKLMGSL